VTYNWDFAVVLREWPLLLAGLVGTAQLAGAALALAIPLGLLLACLRLARLPVISWLAVAVIDFFRTSSLLVLIFWFFYAFPILVNVSFDAFTSATLAIGLHASASFAELFRGGINSISRGQWEAAKALGLRPSMSMRYIILPQAIRRMLPVFFALVIELTKATSLAAAVAVGELAYSGARIATETYRPVETYLVIGALYFVPIFIASLLVRRFERHLATSDA
jgi:polar amino acid transport system permease protein